MSSCLPRKYFGTDGIRGSVGEGYITPDFVMRLGWAAGRVLAKTGRGPVLIGKDTRISGYMLESALEAGLSAAGVDIRLLGPMPSPGIAFLTRSTRAQAGIVISASHNPYHDNGIKFFASDGTKLSDATEAMIEKELAGPLRTVPSARLGKARRISDAPRRYIEFCKSQVPTQLDLGGLRLAVDCANGATYHIAPKVFEELGAETVSRARAPDGLNINEHCGACAPEGLLQLLRETRANVGIALDGDGDRVIMADEKGHLLDGDDILHIIARFYHHELNGGVVGTVMSNLGLEQALNGLGLRFIRAQVGDRHVVEALRHNDLVLGGESSGHIVHLNRTSTGDGIMAALQVLNAMSQSGKSLSELAIGMNKLSQRNSNISLPADFTGDVQEHPQVAEALRQAERTLARRGRVILRASGTEPLVRVMVEGEDPDEVEDLLKYLEGEVEEALEARSG